MISHPYKLKTKQKKEQKHFPVFDYQAENQTEQKASLITMPPRSHAHPAQLINTLNEFIVNEFSVVHCH